MHTGFWWESHNERDQQVIKMDRTEIGWSVMGWINPAQRVDQCRALVNTVVYFRDTSNFGEFFNSLATGDFSGRTQLHGVS
jgi:hypothetical protein